MDSTLTVLMAIQLSRPILQTRRLNFHTTVCFLTWLPQGRAAFQMKALW